MSAYPLTAAEARLRGAAAADRLHAAGVRAGDRIAVLTPEASLAPADSAEAQAAIVCLAMGALQSGVVPVMVNPLLPAAEIAEYVDDAEVVARVTTRPGEPGTLGLLELTDTVGAPANRVELAEVPLGRPMHFTSGTTGRSKGVWSGVVEEGMARDYWNDEAAQWSMDAADTVLNHGPLAHSAPLRFSMLAMMAGARVVFTGPFDTDRVSAAMVEFAPTVAMAVPTHLQRLLRQPSGAPRSTYRMLAHAGSSCPPDLKRAIHTWAGPTKVWEFLGSTEGQFTACRGTEWEDRPGTLGRARVGRTLQIDDGSLASPGVIWCVTPEYARFQYFGEPEKTAGAWRELPAGSAFTVGDLGRLDRDGYLFLHGRRHDLIVTGGMNVYPAEVEAALRHCPGVTDVAVYGVPDETWGDRVCTAIVGDATAEAVHKWCRKHLAGYRRPKEIRVVDALPLTSNGKVKRDGLAEWVLANGR